MDVIYIQYKRADFDNILRYGLKRIGGNVNLPMVSFEIQKLTRHDNPEALRRRIERTLRRWQDLKQVNLSKRDGMLWVSLEKPFYQALPALKGNLLVDLTTNDMQYYAPTASTLTKCENTPRARAPARAGQDPAKCTPPSGRNRHPEWVSGQWLKRYKQLNAFGWKEAKGYFDAYQEDVKDKKLLFEDKDNPDRWQILPYEHRFKDHKIKEKIQQYEDIWTEASKRYRVGVLLTVTFDNSKTIGDINARIGTMFNYLMSWIKRYRMKTLDAYQNERGWKFPHKPVSYLKVLEYQDNGRHHLHIIIFGMSRIADKFTVLTPKLQELGFGPINHVYSLRKRGQGQWLWAGARPEDVGGDPPEGHFKKYLVKALVEHKKTALYWLTCKQFFTCSRNLLTFIAICVELEDGTRWIFKGCYSIGDLPDFLWGNLKHPPDLNKDRPIIVNTEGC